MSEPRIEFLARDAVSVRIVETARKVAATSSTVLITGESGTGKDQLALFIHELSERRNAPCLKIDCASLPPELFESELFGHEKGAFTGAVDRKRGRLELAANGTIVLDEIAALSPAMQAKLLRVLEERSFERLGGTETIKIHSRIMGLTNTNLERAVAAGTFREDLFYRLNVLTISLPPLRERPADILPLAEYLAAKLAAVHGRPLPSLEAKVSRALQNYSWPGNIRELKNALERAIVFCKENMIRITDLPEPIRTASTASAATAADSLRSLEEIEKEAIIATLEATRYQISKSAGILGITRKTLLEKRKKYGLL
ncbi:MAG: sigma-54-dependent Fis family transcriptional regulator [Acidobacteria bacterium]|nr:sigma-54-dependent Fis family transcriptional regulator [Acidobacteriota bacterium]